jgi:hypothetical protein
LTAEPHAWLATLDLETAMMRSVFALGLLIALSAAGNAATVHRSTPPSRTRQHVFVPPTQLIAPGQGVATPGFAVPGWTDEATRRWMDNNTACSSILCGG